MKTLSIIVIVIFNVVNLPQFSDCQNSTFIETVNKAICMVQCPEQEGHCVQKCTQTTQKIEESDREAEANATLICRDVQYIILAHSPGVFVVEHRLSESDNWTNAVISNGTRARLLGREDTLYQYRFYRVSRNGLSKPEPTEWFNTMYSTYVPEKVQSISQPVIQVEPEDPHLLRAELSITPAEDRTCYYEVLCREDTNRVIENYPEETLDLNVIFTRLNFGTEYTVIATAYTQRRIESTRTEMTFTTNTCLGFYNNLTFCAPPLVEDLNAMAIPKMEDIFDVNVTWKLPELIPNSYNVSIFPITAANDHPIMQTVSGDVTSTIFPNVTILEQYDVTISASSSAGRGPSIYDRFVIPKTSGNPSDNIADKNSSATPTNVGTIVTVLLVSLTLIAVVGYVYHRKVNQESSSQGLKYFESLDQKDAALETIKDIGDSEFRSKTDGDKTPLTTPWDKYEISENRLKINRDLGSGAFGVVRLGTLEDDRGQFTAVAVKMLRDDPTEEELRSFELEIKMMKSAGQHPNIVSLLGCCTVGARPLLVVEYCSRGDLQSFLRAILEKAGVSVIETTNRLFPIHKHNKIIEDNSDDSFTTSQNSEDDLHFSTFVANRAYDLDRDNFCDTDVVTVTDLLNFGRQIATGMEFLSSNRVVHRDLAARNVLVCHDRTVKISDFGLSRDIYQENVYKKQGNGRVPIKWMAIESLTHQVYTTCSDVWSFGILLWEIVTFGSSPYPDISANGVLKRLRSGYRMKRPPNCSVALYHVMLACWQANPRDRPTFTALRQELDKMISMTAENEYLDLSDVSNGLTQESTDAESSKISNLNSVHFPTAFRYVNDNQPEVIRECKE